ncbi:MAG: sensor histidine kinase [Paenibacillaceae bacterium]
MSIMRKIMLGYVILIVLPVIIFGYSHYREIYGNLIHQFVESRQKILEQAYANMRTDFTRIQSVHRILQNNSYVVDYLNGAYQHDGESVYSFIRYIRPLYAQSLFANPEIKSIVIYKLKRDIFSIRDQIVDISELEPSLDSAIMTLKPGDGAWIRADTEVLDPELIYYQYLYSTDFTEKIGLLEMRISSSLINQFYKAAGVEGNWQALFMSDQGLLTIDEGNRLDEATIRKLHSNTSTYFINRNTIVNQLDFDELDVRVIVTGQVDNVFHTIRSREFALFSIIVLLLAGLSVAYFLLASTIVKRILKLTRHMRTFTDNNFSPHMLIPERLQGKDEIGFLISTYNSMIMRMDELINKVHRAKLLNKEAAYKVLQAQIKPHFLYNTLETIRMLAESNNDKEVADISFWFGKLMRYSLASGEDKTVLSKEITMVTFYLNIYKMRLQSRLRYEIDVALNADELVCPRFMLQPLIENCIVHGVFTVLRPVHVRIQARESEREIRINVSDDGCGIPSQKLRNLQNKLLKYEEFDKSDFGEGVGLNNVNERIKAFFGQDSRLEITSEEGKGTNMCIVIAKRTVSGS